MDPVAGLDGTTLTLLIRGHGRDLRTLDEALGLLETLCRVVFFIGAALVEEDAAGVTVEVCAAELDDGGKGEQAEEKGTDAGIGKDPLQAGLLSSCIEGRWWRGLLWRVSWWCLYDMERIPNLRSTFNGAVHDVVGLRVTLCVCGIELTRWQSVMLRRRERKRVW